MSLDCTTVVFSCGILTIPVFAGLNPFVECRVDVLHEDYAPFWGI